jgi:hypothetical protein
MLFPSFMKTNMALLALLFFVINPVFSQNNVMIFDGTDLQVTSSHSAFVKREKIKLDYTITDTQFTHASFLAVNASITDSSADQIGVALDDQDVAIIYFLLRKSPQEKVNQIVTVAIPIGDDANTGFALTANNQPLMDKTKIPFCQNIGIDIAIGQDFIANPNLKIIEMEVAVSNHGKSFSKTYYNTRAFNTSDFSSVFTDGAKVAVLVKKIGYYNAQGNLVPAKIQPEKRVVKATVSLNAEKVPVVWVR